MGTSAEGKTGLEFAARYGAKEIPCRKEASGAEFSVEGFEAFRAERRG